MSSESDIYVDPDVSGVDTNDHELFDIEDATNPENDLLRLLYTQDVFQGNDKVSEHFRLTLQLVLLTSHNIYYTQEYYLNGCPQATSVFVSGRALTFFNLAFLIGKRDRETTKANKTFDFLSTLCSRSDERYAYYVTQSFDQTIIMNRPLYLLLSQFGHLSKAKIQ
jgi:hypothetical protein